MERFLLPRCQAKVRGCRALSCRDYGGPFCDLWAKKRILFAFASCGHDGCPGKRGSGPASTHDANGHADAITNTKADADTDPGTDLDAEAEGSDTSDRCARARNAKAGA